MGIFAIRSEGNNVTNRIVGSNGVRNVRNERPPLFLLQFCVAANRRILEQAFVVFSLQPFSRNLRNELKKLRKIYFVDTGVRNALINNFNPFPLRQDGGALWENFMMSERLKANNNQNRGVNMYFWRTHQQQEIDLIEESGGKLAGYEFKWGKKKFKAPQIFQKTYPGSPVMPVTKENFAELV